jgi:hypothetical protein
LSKREQFGASLQNDRSFEQVSDCLIDSRYTAQQIGGMASADSHAPVTGHYRDGNFSNGKVAVLSDAESFAKAPKLVRELVALVAFDPDRVGKPMKTIPVDELLRQLRDTF